MKCTICHHPQRHAIDCDLLAENDTFAALKQKYGPSVSALWRHKKHLKEKMRRAAARLENNLRVGCLFNLNTFLEEAKRSLQTARAEGNLGLALQATREGTRILNFITKLDVQFDQDMVYRLLASPEWFSQGSLLPTDPRFLADSHQALADDLFFPCPAPPPGADDADDEDEQDDRDEAEEMPSFWERTNPGAADLNILPLKNSPAPDPFPTSPPEIAICCFPLPLAPKNQREISAKLPKKPSHFGKINQQYQKDISCEKNAAKNFSVGRESQAPPAVKQAYTHHLEPHAMPNETRETANGKRQTVFAAETGNHQLETRNSKTETLLPPGITRELLQQILPRLVESPDPRETARNNPKINAKKARNYRANQSL